MDLNQVKRTLENLRKITEDSVREDLRRIINSDFDTEIIDSVAASWQRGMKGNGELIGGYRSASYEAMKRAMNPLADGNVDLIYSGSFVSSLIMQDNGTDIINVDASDSKRDKLVSKYGLGIFEVSDDVEKSVIDDAIIEVYKVIGSRL